MSPGHVILGGSLSITEEANKEVNIKVHEFPGKCLRFSYPARTLSEHVALCHKQCDIRRILELSFLLLVDGKSFSGKRFVRPEQYGLLYGFHPFIFNHEKTVTFNA